LAQDYWNRYINLSCEAIGAGWTGRSTPGRCPDPFDGLSFDEGFRADLIANQLVIIELKSVENIHPAHKKQLLTYLKLTGLILGYLLNFGDEVMKNGITRIIKGCI
jgi:hypothetical protein